MMQDACLDRDSQQSVLHWAVQRGVAISVSLLADDRWCSLRSQFLRFDPDQNLLEAIQLGEVERGRNKGNGTDCL